ncbi:MAG: chemotaxis protein CheW [Rhizobiales bacterium]|nr:chemotaxis protein CheW [Hyphomicrobiales bacterium]
MTATSDIIKDSVEFVTVTIGGQLFGLPIARVQDVFTPGKMTRVPLAPAEIAGVLNLRGRIVTAIDMRHRLDLQQRETGSEPMAVGIEVNDESYGLVVDSVGEVMKLPAEHEPVPVNLDVRLARVASGIHRLDGQLLVVLDVDRVLNMEMGSLAA